jgi:ABC-type multidrug transport system fused ATPase/permease subunit
MEDMTFRSINILKKVSVIFSEDTRVTGLLLNHFAIKKKLISLHDHNEDIVKEKVLEYLSNGFDVGLVTDRGTPIISDPGYKTVKYVSSNGYNVVALPGANAFVPALITSGIAPAPFTFYGFLDSKDSKKKKESFKNGDIEFNNIDYSYNMYDYPIKNYSLKIKENSKVLVMGKSGSGKSTLFKLLDRLYNPIKGSIKINNINILDYSLNTIRNNISYISQDEAIFNDTILNNITLNMDVDKNKLNTVLELCEVNDILNKKSLRLDTMIREDVSNLSGGERSRIIMARELLKDNPIIIFDETFSAVEESDANKMINNIFNYYNNKTFIIISHFKPSYHFDLIVSGGFNG